MHVYYLRETVSLGLKGNISQYLNGFLEYQKKIVIIDQFENIFTSIKCKKICTDLINLIRDYNEKFEDINSKIKIIVVFRARELINVINYVKT